MKSLKKTLLALIMTALLGTTSVFAAEGSSRSVKKLSFAFSMLSDPYPNISALNVGYNVSPWLQLHGGYGSSSYGVGARLFVPSWNLSPFVGVGYSILNVTSALTVGTTTISESFNTPYWSAGLEWQTHYGLLLGVTYNTGLTGALAGIPLPGFRLGWTF